MSKFHKHLTKIDFAGTYPRFLTYIEQTLGPLGVNTPLRLFESRGIQSFVMDPVLIHTLTLFKLGGFKASSSWWNLQM